MSRVIIENDEGVRREMTGEERSEIYNALQLRAQDITGALEEAEGVPDRIRNALEQSRKTCEALAEELE